MDSAELELTSPVEERHIDFILEEEFVSNPRFLEYFVQVAVKTIEHTTRTPESPCSKSTCLAARSVVTGEGESDVLVVYSAASGSQRKVALLVEDKIRAGFQPSQADRYISRGEAGIGKSWDAFWTCLVCPQNYAKDNAGFDAKVTLEQLLSYFEETSDARSIYKASVIRGAIKHSSFKGVQQLDPSMTSFRKFYSDVASDELAGTDVIPDAPRDAWWGDSWFTFRHAAFPKSTVIYHKPLMGVVQLNFQKMTVEALTSLLKDRELPVHSKIVSTGKGSSLQLQVEKLEDFTTPESTVENLREAFRAVKALAAFQLGRVHTMS